jgi:hypothetical protein
MNLGQHKFTADIFKTIFGGKGMGGVNDRVVKSIVFGFSDCDSSDRH